VVGCESWCFPGYEPWFANASRSSRLSQASVSCPARITLAGWWPWRRGGRQREAPLAAALAGWWGGWRVVVVTHSTGA
jgi:hypothetical protein